jgi:hypothetical protein
LRQIRGYDVQFRSPSQLTPVLFQSVTPKPGVDELYDWYRSDLFRQYWVRFRDGYLKVACSAANGSCLNRGPSFDTIMKTINHGEALGKQRFSGDVFYTDNWTKEDWYAYVLFKVVNAKFT